MIIPSYFCAILRTTVVKVFKNKTPIGLNLKQYACWQQILTLGKLRLNQYFWQHWYNLPIFCTVSVLEIKQMSFKLMIFWIANRNLHHIIFDLRFLGTNVYLGTIHTLRNQIFSFLDPIPPPPSYVRLISATLVLK